MNIDNKFSIGQRVWYVSNCGAFTSVVTAIKTVTTGVEAAIATGVVAATKTTTVIGQTNISYVLETKTEHSEQNLRSSLSECEELILATIAGDESKETQQFDTTGPTVQNIPITNFYRGDVKFESGHITTDDLTWIDSWTKSVNDPIVAYRLTSKR